MSKNIQTMHRNLELQFNEVLTQIQQAKQKAYSQVNAALIELYWRIGGYISEQINNSDWGKGVVTELSHYITQQDAELKSFSARNLWRMKQFHETYQEDKKLSTLCTQLSWSHNRRIMTLKTPEEREFYLRLCAKQKYSVRELDRLINTSTFERTMLADQKLSDAVKQLPQATTGVFKDSYVLEFLDLPTPHQEKDLQHALLASLKDFILELGIGFAFVGQEYRLQVGTDDFYIDLLFYHRQLQCLVAFELKTDKFSPSHLGQLEFYLEALDSDVKLAYENPSIGVLLCREKNDEVVKYALNRSLSPTVISEYETKLIPKEVLRNKLNEFYALLEGDKNE